LFKKGKEPKTNHWLFWKALCCSFQLETWPGSATHS